MEKDPSNGLPVFTIGHSTRSLEELVEILSSEAVRRLVDIRTVRRSRHNPQFNEETLPGSLRPFGIDYDAAPGLGGLRQPRANSRNLGWRNASFRGFADYMETPEFQEALDDIIRQSRDFATAIMCAEAVPWRCHRSLVADALVLQGVPVRHLTAPGRAWPHRPTPFLVPRSGRPTYPADPTSSTLEDFV
jgi:uncharacterized protein (DUF488 family)